jgi:hypothetical protein
VNFGCADDDGGRNIKIKVFKNSFLEKAILTLEEIDSEDGAEKTRFLTSET